MSKRLSLLELVQMQRDSLADLINACVDEIELLRAEVARLERFPASLLKRAQSAEDRLEKCCEALWGFDYNPDGEKRGYFCAGCDIDGGDRATMPEAEHDAACQKARAVLAANLRRGCVA